MDWANRLDPIVTTVTEIAAGKRPVLLVLHDEGHGGWQFYDGLDVTDRSPTFIPKDVILATDTTLAAVTDLPVGWKARRAAVGEQWFREPYSQD
jgi:hypothetical protein